jgi:hypothetical protein
VRVSESGSIEAFFGYFTLKRSQMKCFLPICAPALLQKAHFAAVTSALAAMIDFGKLVKANANTESAPFFPLCIDPAHSHLYIQTVC